MVLSYGWFGWMAVAALVVNLALIIALMTLIGATLTMPGIAGIVLTIGMAVDFERADLRAHPRGAEDGARAGAGDRPRLREGAVLDHRRQRDDADRRGDPLLHGHRAR